jgi:hypothetical protein
MPEVYFSTQGFRVRCRGQGFAISGPGFYVWDEQLSAALERARLLRPSALQRHPPTASGRVRGYGSG